MASARTSNTRLALQLHAEIVACNSQREPSDLILMCTTLHCFVAHPGDSSMTLESILGWRLCAPEIKTQSKQQRILNLDCALQLHAEIVASNSQSEPSQPAKVSAHVKAQSLQVAAQSLEAQAEMQTLQDQARVHGEALADAQAQAEELNAQAQAHAQAHANASVNAGRLVAHSSIGGFPCPPVSTSLKDETSSKKERSPRHFCIMRFGSITKVRSHHARLLQPAGLGCRCKSVG